MQIDEEGWFVRPPMTNEANAWSVFEYHAQDRVSEFLVEAELDRLAGLARGIRSQGSLWPHPQAMRAFLSLGRSALAAFARRLSPRLGRRAG